MLKSKRGGSNGPIKAMADHTSMNMECDNSAVTNMDCLREGFEFPGANLRDLVTADEEECVRHCRDTEDCKALSFRKSDHTCFLKSRRGGKSGPEEAAIFHSLNMVSDRSEFVLSCVEENTFFPSPTIRNLFLDNIETCIVLCRDTQDCMSVTYGELDNECRLNHKEFERVEQKRVSNFKSSNMNCLIHINAAAGS